MNNQQYHANTDRISKSGLDLIHRSPAHYYAKYLDPNRPTIEENPFERNALKFGQLCHCAVFEYKKLSQEFAIIPAKLNANTNIGKEKLARFVANNINKIFVHEDEFDEAMLIRNAVLSHPMAHTLIENGVFEEVIEWTCPDTGVLCKSRFDCRSTTEAGVFITDLKTTEDASSVGFGKSVAKWRYHVQGAFYGEAFLQKFGRPVDGFIFIAVEKSPPYAVKLHYLTSEQITLGKEEYVEDLLVYKECRSTGIFPGYSQTVSPVQLPGWYKKTA